MSELFARLADFLGFAVPPYAMAAIVVILLYAVQSEFRFGKKARTYRSGSEDRGSTRSVSLSSLVPIVGFALIGTVRIEVAWTAVHLADLDQVAGRHLGCYCNRMVWGRAWIV